MHEVPQSPDRIVAGVGQASQAFFCLFQKGLFVFAPNPIADPRKDIEVPHSKPDRERDIKPAFDYPLITGESRGECPQKQKPAFPHKGKAGFLGRGDMIRTCDLLLPKQAL